MDTYRQLCQITADELLQRYASGERSFEYIDLLEGSSLRGAVLAGVIFDCSWTSMVDFREADLRNASFIESNVKVSDFRRADLRGATFRGCVLCGSIWKGAHLDGVTVEDTTYYGTPVEDMRDLEILDLKAE
ncbi:MAG TPA: pentapeptide repeat-containing protein [Candidatus Angelobacter sp.]|nr:pentapeptide repeat-containing protein [Candidatus Angelobacter sp.]